MCHLNTEFEIKAGQQTMSGQNEELYHMSMTRVSYSHDTRILLV